MKLPPFEKEDGRSLWPPKLGGLGRGGVHAESSRVGGSHEGRPVGKLRHGRISCKSCSGFPSGRGGVTGGGWLL